MYVYAYPEMSILQAGHKCSLNLAVPLACSCRHRENHEVPSKQILSPAVCMSSRAIPFSLYSESWLALSFRKRTKVLCVCMCVCVCVRECASLFSKPLFFLSFSFFPSFFLSLNWRKSNVCCRKILVPTVSEGRGGGGLEYSKERELFLVWWQRWWPCTWARGDKVVLSQ